MGIQERKERERERRRQQIIVAAKRVFSDKGFSRATMEDIAKEAELSPGTLYLYFKNKDELYASLSIRILQYLLIRLEHVAKEANTSLGARMESLKKAMLDVYDFDPLVIINMFHLQSSDTLRNLSPDLLAEIEALSRKALGIMARILEEGIQEGVFIDRHPFALADILWALFSGVILLEESKKVLNADKDFVRPTFELAFDIFARGLQAPKPD
ncbi:MAG: TetR/AcrR family transcriptional regulator [Desulfobacterales bacterium]